MAWKGLICSVTLEDGYFVKVSKKGPVIAEWVVVEIEDTTAA